MGVFGHEIDRAARTVRVSLLGMAEQSAAFRDGLGCALTHGREAAWPVMARGAMDARTGAAAPPHGPKQGIEPREAVWPDGERADPRALPDDLDAERLRRAADAVFVEPDGRSKRRMRALVVVHRGRIVAERYANGFNAAMPLLGWSMTKTVLNLYVGVLVQKGLVGVGDTDPLPQWRNPGDGRAAITLDQLLRMSSGLSFSEVYDHELSDVVTMLFARPDAAAYAAQKPLAHPPGSRWYYSSGSANIASAALRHRLEGRIDYLTSPRKLLFEPSACRAR